MFSELCGKISGEILGIKALWKCVKSEETKIWMQIYMHVKISLDKQFYFGVLRFSFSYKVFWDNELQKNLPTSIHWH